MKTIYIVFNGTTDSSIFQFPKERKQILVGGAAENVEQSHDYVPNTCVWELQEVSILPSLPTNYINILLLLLLVILLVLLKKVGSARLRVIYTLSVRRPQTHNTNL